MKYLIIFLLFFMQFLNPTSSQNFHIDWQNCYGGTKSEQAEDIIKTNGGYLVVGYTNSIDGDVNYNHGDFDIWLLKIDSLGTLLWQKSYGGSSGDGAMRIFSTTNGSYYIVGGSLSSDGDISIDPFLNSDDFWIIKIDNIGNIIWERIIGSPTDELIANGTITSDGGIIEIGTLHGGGGGVLLITLVDGICG